LDARRRLGHHDIDALPDEFGREGSETVRFAAGSSILDYEVSPLNVFVLEERLTEPFPKRLGCAEQQDADACDLRCRLRVDGERCHER